MKKRVKHLIITLVSLFSFPTLSIIAQDQQMTFIVDSATVSYRVRNGVDQGISPGSTLVLSDSIKVVSENGFDGYMNLHSAKGESYSLFSPKGPCKLKDALFSDAITMIYRGARGFLNGLFYPEKVSMAALRHHWGETNNIEDGLTVQFVRNNQVYGSFHETPFDEPCSILMSNTSDSVRVYSLVYQYKTKESNPVRTIVMDCLPGGEPIILVPGESVLIQLPFIRTRGYLVYYLNIFGGTSYFTLNVRDDSPGTAEVYGEKQSMHYSRFFYESDE